VGAPLLGALGRATILTRGPKALGAAVTAGLTVSWNAPTARSFEVIEHVVANAPPAARIVVQVDGSGEGPIVERLRAAGFEVESVAAYRWTWPSDLGPAQRLVQAVAERSVDAVTFTAAPAMRNFFHLARQAQAADDVVGAFAERAVLAVCVGPACAEEAARHGVADPVVPAQARVGAMVQAFTAAVAPRRQVFSLAGVELVIQGRLVRTATGEAVRLSDRERDLLGALSRRPGAVVSKPALLREVWGAAESDTHVVEVAVGRLRQRLAAVGVTIETVVRRGYRLSG
jgi:uroporphyrinogen-III synthase